MEFWNFLHEHGTAILTLVTMVVGAVLKMGQLKSQTLIKEDIAINARVEVSINGHVKALIEASKVIGQAAEMMRQEVRHDALVAQAGTPMPPAVADVVAEAVRADPKDAAHVIVTVIPPAEGALTVAPVKEQPKP